MKFRLLPSLISAAVLMAPSLLSAAAFTPGNIAVFRAGNGTALSANGNPIFLDEYTTTGTLVQSIALPTTVSGGNQQCVTAGNATSEGLISLSTDGNYLVGACYASNIPAASGLAASTSVAVPRVIFRVGANGVADTTTALTDAASAGNPRSAASTNGTDLWMSSSSSGVNYATFGATTSTQVAASPANLRQIGIGGGQLLVSTSSGAFRLASVGTGTPTTSGQTITNLNGLPTATVSPYGFVALDRSASVAGIDTIYFADDRASPSGGIFKYSFDGTIWTARGSITGTARGLAGQIDAGSGNVVFYTTGTTTTANAIQTATDTAAFDANIAGTLGNLTTPVSAPTATAFRGIAFVPAAAQPNLTIAAASGTEGDTPGCSSTQINFTVTSDTVAPIGGIAFTYSTADGTATLADTDYVQVTGGAGSIAAGTTTGTASVNITCDKNAESNETFSVNLIDGASYNLGLPSTATGTINDDDTPVVTIADISQSEGDSGTTTMTFTVQLDRPAPTGGVGYSYFTGDVDATAGSDYVALGPQIGFIAAGAASQQHAVTINGDTDFEGNETFNFSIASVAPVAAAGNDFVATGTIQNDDATLLPTISINDVSIAEGNAGTSTLTFNVTLSAPAPVGGVTFDIATTDGTATDADNDYEPRNVSGQTITAGNSNYSFDVTINGDFAAEPDEAFNVTISPVSGIAAVGNDLSATGTLLADEGRSISIVAAVSLAEGNTAATTSQMVFPITVNFPAPAGGVNFTLTAFGGSGAGSATAGIDFTAPPSSVTYTIPEGQTTLSPPYTVAIHGDLAAEDDEIFAVIITCMANCVIDSGSGPNLGISTATILNDDTAPLSIEAIQGTGHASPVATQVVTTLGNIVTAVLPAPNGGFMIQTPDALASGDMATSNGLFVFTGGTPIIAVGDAVDVRGTIVEFSTSGTATAAQRTTEFTNTGLVFNIVSNGNPLPAPVVLDAMVPSPNPATPYCGVGLGNFECIESMRVTTSTGMINLGNQTFGTDPIAEMWVTTSGQRVFREGGIVPGRETEIVPVLTPPAPPVPSTYVYDLNPEVFELDMDRAGLPNTILVPGTTFSATGVLTQEFGGFEMFPTQFTVNAAAPAIPLPVATATATQLTLGSQNLHLLFDDVNDPWNTDDCTAGDVDFCPTTVRWNAKLNLLSRQIREQLKSPMVVAVQEVEKLGALQALAAKINTDLGPTPPFTYTAHVGPIDDLDGGHQNVGFLIRSDVTIISLTQFNTTQMWTFNGTPQGEVMDRPPYLLRASIDVGGPDPFEFAVMVAHQRSLTGIDDLDPLADQIDAHRVRQKRLYQAALTAQAIQQFRSSNPNLPFYLLGDFNAFPESDGYADVTGIIQGTTNPALSEYDLSYFGLEGTGPNGNIVDPPLTAGSSLTPAGERYSYQFQNMPQQIDHAMMSAAGLDRFEDMQFARNNVDQQARFLINFSNSLGTETPLVSSDHDGFVLFIDARGVAIFSNGFED